MQMKKFAKGAGKFLIRKPSAREKKIAHSVPDNSNTSDIIG